MNMTLLQRIKATRLSRKKVLATSALVAVSMLATGCGPDTSTEPTLRSTPWLNVPLSHVSPSIHLQVSFDLSTRTNQYGPCHNFPTSPGGGDSVYGTCADASGQGDSYTAYQFFNDGNVSPSGFFFENTGTCHLAFKSCGSVGQVVTTNWANKADRMDVEIYQKEEIARPANGWTYGNARFDFQNQAHPFSPANGGYYTYPADLGTLQLPVKGAPNVGRFDGYVVTPFRTLNADDVVIFMWGRTCIAQPGFGPSRADYPGGVCVQGFDAFGLPGGPAGNVFWDSHPNFNGLYHWLVMYKPENRVASVDLNLASYDQRVDIDVTQPCFGLAGAYDCT
jgi:hypothetical protein